MWSPWIPISVTLQSPFASEQYDTRYNKILLAGARTSRPPFAGLCRSIQEYSPRGPPTGAWHRRKLHTRFVNTLAFPADGWNSHDDLLFVQKAPSSTNNSSRCLPVICLGCFSFNISIERTPLKLFAYSLLM